MYFCRSTLFSRALSSVVVRPRIHSLIADPASYVLSAAAGGVLLLGYVAVFVAAGALLVSRRDVT